MALDIRQEEVPFLANSVSDNTLDYETTSTNETVPEEQDGLLRRTTGMHEYELNQSESLSFLYNLLYDENSVLSKSDILSILNCLKMREDVLPFAIADLGMLDFQGVKWPLNLKEKFRLDRSRIGKLGWFCNIPNSREIVRNVSRSDVFAYLHLVISY